MKLLDVLDTDPIQVSMKDHAMESFEIDEKTKTPDRSGHYWSSSGVLRHYVERNYGGDVTCRKAQKIKGDANARKAVRNAASFYQNLHCVGSKQVDEEDTFNQGAALTIFDIDDTLFKTDAKVHVDRKSVV